MFENRYSRQEDLVPRDELDTQLVTIIGCGAIGRQVAIQCAAIGVPRIKLIDFDTVEPENLAPQGFMEEDLNRSKVDAVAEMCKKINSEINITTINEAFDEQMFSLGVVFCCVDKIKIREQIFNAIGNKCDLFIDGRMSSEYMRVLSCFDDNSKQYYSEKAIFPEQEAFTGSCTAKTTIYCSNIVAGFMVANFAKWLRDVEIEKDIKLNLLVNELLLG